MSERLVLNPELIKKTRKQIIEQMRLCGHGSPPFLQKNLKISYDSAKEICDRLIYPNVKIENGCSSKHKLKN